ncbi:MAG TPA: ABC transporter ATP-binding protein [Syntrophales bacterium]|nr:ABC transporter ATP-binding protein [Syntrophales bacterium]HOL59332.1 ABC transporter ATP-binding protein [Syntrophales bacterium]HPO35475.1 ABC transporter ATP-binding protein [Syntrophales bacterium]
MNGEAFIEVKNLKKTFIKDGAQIEVLKGIDLLITRGESIAIVGASGAGKSTLLHIMGTLDRPSSGTVMVKGKDVFTWNEKDLALFRNRTIGFVFQFHNLMPEFSTLENVMLPALIGGISRGEAKRRATEILKDLGLKDRLHHKPGELSGGEQQRVAVARAMVMEPEIILADEPTGNLDTETGKRIEDILVNLNQEKKITLILVTHNPRLADRMSRMVGLQDGKIA